MLRERLRGALAERVAVLEQVADGLTFINRREKCPNCGHVAASQSDEEIKLVTPSPSDRLRALDIMAKYGMGETVGADDVRERLRQQLDVIRTTLPAEHANALLARLSEVWAA